jgi:hypothetical protein
MKEKVVVAAVQVIVYFLIINKLREQDISSSVYFPETLPAKMTLVLSRTRKNLINYEQIMFFYSEDKLDR